MSTALSISSASLPATAPAVIAKLVAVQEFLLANTPQLPIRTEHVLHGGMYARTIRMEAGTVLTGALIKVPTMLVVESADCAVLVGEEWGKITGYNVFPARAGRKQVFVAYQPTIITMLFATKAQTVEDAEREFTDEYALLLSHHSTDDLVIITGE